MEPLFLTANKTSLYCHPFRPALARQCGITATGPTKNPCALGCRCEWHSVQGAGKIRTGSDLRDTTCL